MLAWRLSNTMDVGFCVMALEEELARFGRPDIFNTDQGSQFSVIAHVPGWDWLSSEGEAAFGEFADGLDGGFALETRGAGDGSVACMDLGTPV